MGEWTRLGFLNGIALIWGYILTMIVHMFKTVHISRRLNWPPVRGDYLYSHLSLKLAIGRFSCHTRDIVIPLSSTVNIKARATSRV